MKIDEFLKDQLELTDRELEDDKVINLSITNLRSLLFDWTAEMIIENELINEGD